MTYEEYLEFDKLAWEWNSLIQPPKKLVKLLEKWNKLTEEQQYEYINKKNNE